MLRMTFLVAAVLLIPAIVFDSDSSSASMAGIPVSSDTVSQTSGQQVRQNTFFIQVDPNNQVIHCSGSGYMKGACYRYPSSWWNMWFYSGPYDPGLSKQVSTILQVVPADPNEPGYAEIAYAWSTPLWSELRLSRPPLPVHSVDEDIESRYIARYPFRQINLQARSEPQTVSQQYVIPQYNPEWLSIAVRGTNFKVLRGQITYDIRHEQIGYAEEMRIREIILKVIEENPELINRTVNNYLRAKREEDERQQLEMSFKNRITDIEVGSIPARGSENAKITIFAFQDFECPYSQRGAEIFAPLLKQYAGKAKLVFKNRPQTFHPQAAAAAKATLAANMQGRFWDYHDLLFKNSKELGETVFVKLAKELNLNIERFNKDRNSKTVEEQLNRDIAEAEKHNFSSTPTFVMNGVVIIGARTQTYFEDIIKRLLEE